MAWDKLGRKSQSDRKSKIRIYFILSRSNRFKENIFSLWSQQSTKNNSSNFVTEKWVRLWKMFSKREVAIQQISTSKYIAINSKAKLVSKENFFTSRHRSHVGSNHKDSHWLLPTGGSLPELHQLAFIRILFRNPCTPLSHKSVSYEVIHRIFMIANANSKKAYLKIIIQFIHLSSGEWRKWQR